MPILCPTSSPTKTTRRDSRLRSRRSGGPWRKLKNSLRASWIDFYRSRYRDHIEEHFPKLFDLIERRTEVENADDPAAGDMARTGSQKWVGGRRRRDSQDDRRHRRLGRCRAEDQDLPRSICRRGPTTLDIMMAQEDLWVYETLLKVVRNTNDAVPIRSTNRRSTRNRPTTKSPASSKSWRWTSAGTPFRVGPSREGRCSICRARPAAAPARSRRWRCRAAVRADGGTGSPPGRTATGKFQFGQFSPGRPLRR